MAKSCILADHHCTYSNSYMVHKVNELFKQYQPLAYKIANKFAKKYPYFKDDLTNAALFGLWQACNKEREKEVDNFISWSSVFIKNYCLITLKQMRSTPYSYFKNNDKKEAQHFSIEFQTSINGFNNDHFLGVTESCCEEFMDKQEVHYLLESLSESSKDVMKRIYFDEMSYVDIGKSLNVSKQRIGQIKNNSIKIMQELDI